MIQEQARVEVVVEVHQELQATLFHHVLAAACAQLVVLIGARLLAARTQVNVLEGHAGDFGHDRQGFLAATLRARRVHRVRRCVFLHEQPALALVIASALPIRLKAPGHSLEGASVESIFLVSLPIGIPLT